MVRSLADRTFQLRRTGACNDPSTHVRMPGDAGMPTASGGVGNGASVKSVDGTSYRWGDQVPGYHEIDRPTTDVIKAEPGLSRIGSEGNDFEK